MINSAHNIIFRANKIKIWLAIVVPVISIFVLFYSIIYRFGGYNEYLTSIYAYYKFAVSQIFLIAGIIIWIIVYSKRAILLIKGNYITIHLDDFVIRGNIREVLIKDVKNIIIKKTLFDSYIVAVTYNSQIVLSSFMFNDNIISDVSNIINNRIAASRE